MHTNSKIQLYPMLRLVIALIAGIVVADIIGCVAQPLYWMIAMITTLITALLLYKQEREKEQTIFILITVLLLGGYLTCNEERNMNQDLPTGPQTYEGVIVSQPTIKEKTVSYDMIVTNCKAFHNSVKIKLFMFRNNRSERLNMGDGIEGFSQFKQPMNYKNSTFDYKRYLMCHGILAQTFVYTSDWDAKAVSLAQLSLLTRTGLAAIRFRQRLLDKYKSLDIKGHLRSSPRRSLSFNTGIAVG